MGGFLALLYTYLHIAFICKGLTQTDAVRKDAAVEGFELVDDGKRRVPLEVVQHFPDLGVLEAGCLIGQIVLRNILEERAEDVV